MILSKALLNSTKIKWLNKLMRISLIIPTCFLKRKKKCYLKHLSLNLAKTLSIFSWISTLLNISRLKDSEAPRPSSVNLLRCLLQKKELWLILNHWRWTIVFGRIKSLKSKYFRDWQRNAQIYKSLQSITKLILIRLVKKINRS